MVPKFTADEALIIAACMRGVSATEEHAALMWRTVQDTLWDEKLDTYYGIDGPALVERLRVMPLDEQLAVMQALDIAFSMYLLPENEKLLECLRHAGLVL